MKRGDVVIVAESKPRPAVIVHSDLVATSHETLICPLTTFLVDAPIYRLPIEPDDLNGLQSVSQIMIDKVGAARHQRIGAVIGKLSTADMARLDVALIVMLDLVGG